MNFDNDFVVRGINYDNDTHELFFMVCSKYMVGLSDNNKLEEGYVYCVDSNLECRKINMPSDKILRIQLTGNYIYYTFYDPVDYGLSIRGGQCIDETGNKIYRVKRNDTTSSELIFDGRGKLLFMRGEFSVTGDYIYLDYNMLVQEDGKYFFRRMGSTARVNVKNNTVKWLNLE